MKESKASPREFRTVQDLAFVACKMCRVRLEQIHGRVVVLGHASTFELDVELVDGLRECGYVIEDYPLTEEAAQALTTYLKDVSDIMCITLRADPRTAAQFYEKQRRSTPFYQLWHVLSVAVTFAEELPLGVEAIKQAIAHLSPPSDPRFGPRW